MKKAFLWPLSADFSYILQIASFVHLQHVIIDINMKIICVLQLQEQAKKYTQTSAFKIQNVIIPIK